VCNKASVSRLIQIKPDGATGARPNYEYRYPLGDAPLRLLDHPSQATIGCGAREP
jgi:hypothetical protein